MASAFDTKLKNYLTVYKVPIGPNQLDPTVFHFSELDNFPVLLPSIRNQILKDINGIVDEQISSFINGCYLVGPVTKPGQKSRTGEIRIIIVLNEKRISSDIDGLFSERILKAAKHASGNLAVGTTRPIEYTVTIRKIKDFDYEGIYDLATNKWLKIPTGVATNI